MMCGPEMIRGREAAAYGTGNERAVVDLSGLRSGRWDRHKRRPGPIALMTEPMPLTPGFWPPTPLAFWSIKLPVWAALLSLERVVIWRPQLSNWPPLI